MTEKQVQEAGYHSGYAALIGRPNVGKSTLLNHIVGQKLSITSRRPQTTRRQLLGINTTKKGQTVYVDTPGFQTSTPTVFNRYMNREIGNALASIDVVVQLIAAMQWNRMDEAVYRLAMENSVPIILAINKIDRVKDRKSLLPFIEELQKEHAFHHIVPISAKRRENIADLEEEIRLALPEGEPVFPSDQVTDKSERFFAAEFIREKLTRRLGEELPYNLSVTIDEFREEAGLLRINATVWVASPGQKAIVIGKDGAVLKSVGEKARKEMEKMFGKKVFLRTWVRVKRKWMDDAGALRQLGYDY